MPQDTTPAEARNLPEDFYGGFDVRQMPDGSKRYRLPHTLFGTVMALVMSRTVLVPVSIATAILTLIFGVPVEPSGLGVIVTVLACHATATVVVTFWALLTGFRWATFIAIRADGLVWNDRSFFPASHILMISYGTTFNTGKSDERFEPLLTIQLGVKTVLLAEHLEPASGKLFEHLFRDDTRRYWHGHN